MTTTTNMTASIKTQPKTLSRIVRSNQGAWKWQTPYRVVRYTSAAGSDGVLRWYRTGSSAKLTAKRAQAMAEYWGDCTGNGGIHGRPVMSDRQRDEIYSRD